ncbi:vacuolar protein sorting-associated protein 13B-like isoform X2 [Haliotis rufescens]|uniref:vacuolar protein sorting-associated protein 13B-like isoform X2 n=1 Tax=Haliotis rufescens TaxID=6454 RepID=UPI00201EE03C|nr:vacuolar protein sorting-associated protein 13B-like isoform X2 [Haliotis rufescens]
MFKIESYIAPLLLGYVDKYVKLSQEDFQVSLWGGDVVLNNLDLRLDVLQDVLQLPIMFKSGHIHELRIHVPWTKLGSEPVVITVNTIECILKVRDTAYGDSASTKSGESQRRASQQARARIKPKRPDPADELPPGYLQSLMNRIVNNVNIIMNNLIIKFVEDDIVLSINVKSAECYGADMNWDRAFVDLTASDLILRKVINFCDLTVCLDKTNTSGRIETYQEPILYRCSVSCRLHMTYDGVNAKLPRVTRFNVSCEKLHLSISDTQLPMFLRLLELCIALYYGTVDFDVEKEEQEQEPDQQEVARSSGNNSEPSPESEGSLSETDDGWMNWAWSFVPQILPTDEEQEYGENRPRGKPSPPLLSIGFYVHQASVTFKLTEKVKESSSQYASTGRINYHPFLYLDSEGLSADILMHGITFFDAQCGVTTLRVSSAGMCICGVKDEGDPRSMVLLQAGESLLNKSVVNYISQSLFDPKSAENQGQAAEFVSDGEKHMERFTEQFGLQKYGAFWFDYLYFMTDMEPTHSGSKSSVTDDGHEALFFHETSIMKILIGPCHLNVSSTLYHRVEKFLRCAWDHQYQPYTSSKSLTTEEDRPEATEEQIKSMEDFIPTRTMHVILVQPSMTLLAAEHAQCDVSRKSYRPAQKKGKDNKPASDQTSKLVLPGGRMSASRFDLEITSPMYPRRLVRLVSNIAGPSSNLLYHCHSHTKIKVFQLHVGLLKVDPSGTPSHLLTLVPPCCGSVYSKYLLLPKYWTNTYLPLTEWMSEMPQLSINLTKASVLLMVKITSSWLHKDPQPGQFTEDSLLTDMFPESDQDRTPSQPVLEIVVSGCEMKCCSTAIVDAYTSSVTSAQFVLYLKDPVSKSNRVAPIFTGPADTGSLHVKTFFVQEVCRKDVLGDCLNFTVQLPKKRNVSEAPAVILLNLEGCVACMDPALFDWLMYVPRSRHSLSASRREDSITVDLALAQAASPLQANMSQVSVHSSSSLTNPTGSRPLTQSHTHTASQLLSPREMDEDAAGGRGSPRQQGIAEKMAELFPLIKMLHIQVEIRSSCIFLPDVSMAMLEPSMDIPVNFHSAFQDGSVPNTLVVCLPSMVVSSSGAKPMSVVQEIPITTLDGSLIGDKLPWSVKLEKLTVYSLHKEKTTLSLFKPLNVASTVAVTCKYTPPTSDNITALGLCLHIDMQPPTIAVSKIQTQLCMSVIQKTLMLVSKGTAFCFHLWKMLQPQKDVPVAQPISSSPDKKVASSLSYDNDVVITDQSEDISREESSPVHEAVGEDSSSSPGVKLSLWTQLLVPRFEVKLYGKEKLSTSETCLTVVAEDVATSIDIQQVYSKVKATMGSFNINHLQKRQDRPWEKGACEGILMSCRGELPRDTLIVSNKLWTSDSQPVVPLFPSSEGMQREQTSGFLTFTFTRALCKNVSKKMKKMNIELSDLTENETESSFDELYFHDYISEVCLKTDPCDVVLYLPVFETLVDIFDFGSPSPDMALTKSASQRLVYAHSHHRKNQSPPFFSAGSLPLIYANIGSVRVILPDPDGGHLEMGQDKTGSDKLNDGTDKNESGDDSGKCKRLKTTLDHDMIVAQLHSITVQPRADNPLPREAVEKDLYHRALHSGIAQYPGSAVEDRQYQADFKGFSLCTGCWGDLVRESKRVEKYKPPVSPGVQIPALEWNTFLALQQEEREEVRLIPMATAFDLCLVMAPAIVYSRKDPAENLKKYVLVCGYAAEMNVTSDLDLYLSTNQIHFMSEFARKSMTHLSGKSEKVTAKSTGTGRSRSSGRAQEHHGIDSGVESDISTVTADKPRHVKSASSSKVVTPVDLGLGSKVMPFHILLTAGRISCTVYTHNTLKDDSLHAASKDEKHKKAVHKSKSAATLKGDNLEHLTSNISSPDSDESYLQQYDTCSDFEFMHINNDGDLAKKVVAPGTVCLKPFLYLYFAQPHTIISCLTSSQRFEMSCYDIIVKGPTSQSVIPVDEHRLLPDCSDFSSYWIESRAGQPHPKTGIPPSLYTLQITDFLQQPACVTLKLERPIKVNLSLNKVDQILDFVEEVTTTSSPSSQHRESPRADVVMEVTSSHSSPGIFSSLDHLEFMTDQIVVAVETVPDDHSPGVMISTSSLRVITEFQQAKHGVSDSLGCELFLKDLLMKTVLDKKTRSLLGPASVNLDLSLVWAEHSGPPLFPQIIFAAETGILPLYVGQDQVVCLQLLAEQVNKFLQRFPSKEVQPEATPDSSVGAGDVTVASGGSQFIHNTTTDDLRTAGFEYIVDHDGSGLKANPGEIVFTSSNSTEDGNSTMTWTYYQPRVLSHVTVMPVPFGLSSDNRPDRVPCLLQYYDKASQQYLGHIDFSLTENQSFSLPLPEVRVSNSQDLVVAQTWRVIIYRDDAEEGEEEEGEGEQLPVKEDNSERDIMVLPASLAACMSVDSCFVPSLIPIFQGCVSMATIQLHLINHLQYLGKGVPTKLAPYIMMSAQPEEQKFAVVTVDELSASFSHLSGHISRSEVQVSTTVGLEVLEHRNLTMDAVLQPTMLDGYLVVLHREKPSMVECNCKTGPAVVRVGSGAVHTLTTSIQAWSMLGGKTGVNKAQAVFSHIVVCNDTQQTVRFGQVGTDENLALASREMNCYSWRSHKTKQLLHVCMDQPSWKWCDPFDINTDTSVIRAVTAKDQSYTVIIKIKQLTNTQKQIIISGQLVMSSRLSQHMEVSLMTSRGDKSVKESTCILGAGHTAPSFIVEQEEVVGVKFRVLGLKTTWSQEVHVNGDRMKENGLIKIPLPDRSTYIHVWCRIFCQHFKHQVQTLDTKLIMTATKRMVLLTPLYILRSHLPRPLYVDMDTPRLKQKQQLQVSGQAYEYQLHCVGGDITHNLAFRLAPTLPKSSPPLVLSTGLIDQVEHHNPGRVDIDQLCYDQPTDPSLTWPYCFPDIDNLESFGNFPPTKTSCLSEAETDVQQPSVDLSIRLSEYMPGCSTLLVDITPWCLITNLSGITIVLLNTTGKLSDIPHGKTYTPPAFQSNEFHVGLYHKGKVLATPAIPISEDEVANKRYSPDLGRVLFVDGYVHTTIRIPGDTPQAVFLTIVSEMKQDMRIVTVRERFAITNLTSAQLELRLLAVPLGHSKVNWRNMSYSQSPELIPSHKNLEKKEENVCSLLTWSLIPPEKVETEDSRFVHYLAIRETIDSSEMESSKWSLPLRLASNKDGARLCVSVPNCKPDEACTKPYCVTAKIHDGVTYLVMEKDRGPVCVINNNCSFPIIFGQALMNITLSGTVVQEEAELLDDLPTLDPGSSTHYTMPYVNNQYPAADAITHPRMHFCANLSQDDGSFKRSMWSNGVDVMSNNDTFVKLPDVADIKVQSRKVAMVTHITIEPISKAEISAKEIRSRLKGAETETKVVEVTPESNQVTLPGVDVSKTESKLVRRKDKSGSVYVAGVFIEHISFVMMDETTSTETVSEVLRLCCDSVYAAHFPVSTSADSTEAKSCMSLSVGTMQLDNQQYGQGQYDFPVLLVKQKTQNMNMPDLEKMTVTEKHAVLRLSSFLHAQLVLTADDAGNTVTESVELSLSPLSLYIDDTFIYRLLREMEAFIPNILHCDINKPIKVKRLPKSVKSTACALSQPVRIHYLCIQPISMLLSVHASMKLFLASDHTPLSFGKFERKNLYTSSHQLTRALAMHYASGAIFRAGIVVGSLEILGNPTGLVRSIGTGVADMFRLPYTGLTRGPGAFIGGISGGMSSLLRNVSAGMITSVTNFASSVSRNMDRLSLDEGHLQRQEENRRNRPVGVSDGLKQGLTGFGISLLGAVAGLADQPIQSLISHSQCERPASTSATATGLVAGMGKGLVGIVTKPIGGAAEFVSQTGQGILHGTGLGNLPERRHPPTPQPCCEAKNGVYKYTQKIFSSLPATDILLAVDGLHLDLTGLEVEVTLLLTPEILFVVSSEEDSQQQAFAVGELEMTECPSDDTLITIVWNDNYYKTTVESEASNKDRVAAFIDSAPTLALPVSEDVSVSDSQSESMSPGGTHILVPQYQFRFAPNYRELFFTMFQQAKNNIQGRGFSV